MYVDGSATSNQSPPMTPARSGLQQGTPSRQTAASALMDLKEGYNSVWASEGQDTGPGPKEHNPPSAFHPINRPSSSVQVSSSPQVTYTQGMALLETQSTQEMTLHRPTPVHIMDPAVTAITSAKTIPCVQLTNTPVSFASTTQVRMDVPIPPTVNSVAPSISMETVPISQNPGVSSTVNARGTSQPQDHNINPCRKCGKKNHKTDKCNKKTFCKKCKSKEHKMMFCTVDPVLDRLCTFCASSYANQGIQLNAAELARKLKRRLEPRNQELPEATCQTRRRLLLDRPRALLLQPLVQQDPTLEWDNNLLKWCPPLMIGERLQQLALSADGVTVSSPSGGMPPLTYMEGDRMDPGRAYSTAGSAHSIPTSAPGMYDYTNGGGTRSTSSNSSLESHMSQLSRTMLQLAQTNQVMANHQCQNHQAMVNVQKQQTEAFNALAAATEQRKYDNLFAMIPKFDGTNKEDCAIWLSWVDQLVTSTGRDL